MFQVHSVKKFQLNLNLAYQKWTSKERSSKTNKQTANVKKPLKVNNKISIFDFRKKIKNQMNLGIPLAWLFFGNNLVYHTPNRDAHKLHGPLLLSVFSAKSHLTETLSSS